MTSHALLDKQSQRSGDTHSTSKGGFPYLALDVNVATPKYLKKDSRLRKFNHWLCKLLASSSLISVATTVLTVFALFGDDMRMILTSKPSDQYFNIVTIVSLIIFSLEVLIFCCGKAGYIFGFFFWLDLISTVTLVLDITNVSESLFGDAISKAQQDGSQAQSGASNSGTASAQRAARMSQGGTRAGRVVRLMRLIRLIRLMKVGRGNYDQKAGPEPGESADWEEDDGLDKESAVSKKLSEMTTRRVIMLVLVIMIVLPFFQTDEYNESLTNSAQYGINALYRRWIDDLNYYQPWINSSAYNSYAASNGRRVYLQDFFTYSYYHNPLTKDDLIPDAATNSPLGSFSSLFFIGISPGHGKLSDYFLPTMNETGNYDLNALYGGNNWFYYQGNLTDDPTKLLAAPWNQTRSCIDGYIRGVSLLSLTEPALTCPELLRYTERVVVGPTTITQSEDAGQNFLFVFDTRKGARMEAALNIAQTLFICFLLGFGALAFSSDANRLVLTPIERMISKLDKIRSNPLEAMMLGDDDHAREPVSKKNRDLDAMSEVSVSAAQRWHRRFTRLLQRRRGEPQQAPEPMETVVLEKTIIKIGSLLALGFGEAGAEIIGQNMRGGDNSALDAMVPGRKVEAVFAYCDIRNFIDITEVLQDEVMIFVNRIAAVVHSCANEFFGNPNKNFGNAFLLAWRLSDQSPSKQQKLADMAVVSIIKIIANINKSSLLAEYRNHPKLVKRLPNYRVRMAFGMHSGWAIEGAIGSEFKIDASYLSPDVDMAARLEACNKQYGTLVLISEMTLKLTSESVADECRVVDHLQLSSKKTSFKLYTLDLDDLALEVEPGGASGSFAFKVNKYRQRRERERLKNERWSDDFNLHSKLFTGDPDIITMRRKFTEEFFCRFNMAYLNYEAGEWLVAKNLLEVTRFMLSVEDGPSAALLRFMKQHEFESPPGWQGYRIFSDK